MSTLMKLSEIFDAAAGVVERNGHHKRGWFGGPAGRRPAECPVCEGGAVNVVILGSPELDDGHGAIPRILWDAYEVLANRTGLLDGILADIEAGRISDDRRDACIVAIGRWNDAPERTAGQVIAELRAAAADMRAEGR